MITLKNICKYYNVKESDTIKALSNINLTLDKGLVFIVGKSGSGKSTLVNMLGMIDKPTSGEIIIDQKSSLDFNSEDFDYYRAIYVGFVFQEFHIINGLNICENITLAQNIKGIEVKPSEVEQVLNLVGLKNFEKRKINQLSGGELQRVSIARALIKNPKIIIADEPTGNLDSNNAENIFSQLKKISKDKLVVVVSHDFDSALKYADRIVELSNGVIIKDYKPKYIDEVITINKSSLDNNDLQEINEYISKGKQVNISNKIENEEINTPINLEEKFNIDIKPRLRFKNSLKLALSSMKKRILRLIVLVILVSLSISVIGFTALFSLFDGDNLLLTDLESSDLPFTNLVSTFYDDYGIYTYTSDNIITANNSSLLDDFPYNYARVYQNPKEDVLFPQKNYFLPAGSPQFSTNTISGFIEVKDFSQMNFNLTHGRYPSNNDEIVITNYMLSGMITNGVYILSDEKYSESWIASYNIKDFSDIENKRINLTNASQFQNGVYYSYRVVGMISYDLSKYESLSEVNYFKKITKEDLELFSILEIEKHNFLNCIYTVEGFYDEYIRINPIIFSTNLNISYNNNIVTINPKSSFYTLSDYFFDNHSKSYWNGYYLMYKDNFNKESLGDNQIVINFPIIFSLVGEEIFLKYDLENHKKDPQNYDIEYIKHIMDEEKLWDIPINLEAIINVQDKLFVSKNKTFEIVGIVDQTPELFIESIPYIYISGNFLEDFDDLKITTNILVMTETKEEKTNLLKTIRQYKIINEEKLDTVIESGYYFQISTMTSKLIYKVIENFKFLNNLFQVVSIVFFIFSLIMIYNFVSLSIFDRKKDIGIMRSMGASNFNVSKVFIIETSIILLLVIIISFIFCKIENSLFNAFYINKITFLHGYDSILVYSYREILLMIITSIIGFVLSTIIPLLRIRKFMPIVTIRKN